MAGQHGPIQKEECAKSICINFRDLNKPRPKDFSSCIWSCLYETTDYDAFSFMDEYSGYNKIKMHLDDAEMVTGGVVCDQVMSFGLRTLGPHIKRK